MKGLNLASSLVLLTTACAHATPPPQALTAPLPARVGALAVTPELLLAASAPQEVHVSSGLAWVGGADRLVYAYLDPELKKGVIELLDTDTGRRIRLADGSDPRVSPDGLWLSYRRSTATDTVLYLMRIKDRRSLEVARFTDQEFRNLAYAWAPDSRRIAVGWRSSFARSWRGSEGANQTQTTAVDLDGPVDQLGESELKVYDVDGTPPRLLMKTTGVFQHIEWYPSGNDILYSVVHFGFERRGGETSTFLGRLNVATGKVVPLLNLEGARQRLEPAISPDGRRIALTLDFDNGPYDLLPSVALIASERWVGSARQLTRDAKMQAATWSDDGRAIVATRRYGAYSQVYRIDPTSGAMMQLTNVAADTVAMAIGTGGRIAILSTNAHSVTEIKVASLHATVLTFRQVAELAQPPIEVRLAEVREIAWESNDGVLSRGLVFLPDRNSDQQRYPLVVDLHGGLLGASLRVSGGALLYDTPLEFHMWAAKGYIVLVPEFRSSGALGQKPLGQMREDRDAYGFHGDEKDILAGIERLVDVGFVDPSRVAILGFSGGAAEVNWLVGHTRNRFRAAVSCDGFAETYLLTAVGAAAGGDAYFANIIGGWPWEIADAYLENSATYHARGASTPTLFLMGASAISGVDPALSSQFLYTALKRQGVDTRYVWYAHEGHGLVRAANRRDSLMRAVEWIDRHM